MGFLARLFKSTTREDTALKEKLRPKLITMGMSSSEAEQMLDDLMATAKKRAREDGTINLPENFGDVLLENEQDDLDIQKKLKQLRSEGVTDDDIRWWWNKSEIERKILLELENLLRVGWFSKLIEEGAEPEEAADKIRKTLVIYGDPEDTRHVDGDDRPIPFELQRRIDEYLAQAVYSKQDLVYEMESFSSVNAFIRKKIKEGTI